MSDPALSHPGSTHQPDASTAPTITAVGGVITGAGFLPDREVTVRIAYTAEGISDYLTYTTDLHGNLRAVGVGAVIGGRDVQRTRSGAGGELGA